jgi:hypothetical protein
MLGEPPLALPVTRALVPSPSAIRRLVLDLNLDLVALGLKVRAVATPAEAAAALSDCDAQALLVDVASPEDDAAAGEAALRTTWLKLYVVAPCTQAAQPALAKSCFDTVLSLPVTRLARPQGTPTNPRRRPAAAAHRARLSARLQAGHTRRTRVLEEGLMSFMLEFFRLARFGANPNRAEPIKHCVLDGRKRHPWRAEALLLQSCPYPTCAMKSPTVTIFMPLVPPERPWRSPLVRMTLSPRRSPARDCSRASTSRVTSV